jgi:hypothetical protein
MANEDPSCRRMPASPDAVPQAQMIQGTPAFRRGDERAGDWILLGVVPYVFYSGSMDWDFAIERNREPLLRHVLGLFALIGLVEGGMVERLSRPVYRRALTVLKSAESAVRRLIVVMARDIVVEPRPKRPAPKGFVRPGRGHRLRRLRL